jgi:hypothetical protein
MTEAQIDMNESWQFDRSMSPANYLRVTKSLGLRRAEAARYFGVSIRTERRFANGEADIPVAIVLLLRALIHFGGRPVVPLAPRYAREAPTAQP